MDVFFEQLKHIIPTQHYRAVVATFESPKQLGIRLNRLKAITIDVLSNLVSHPLRPTKHDDIYLAHPDDREALTHSKAFSDGLFYIQNLSSMLPALLLELESGQEILDLCAAPGSKTSQIATLINNEGHIAAVERNKKRYFKLQDNLHRQGVTCAKLFLRDGKTVYRHCQDKFDRVLVDAPCSSEAVFNTQNPDSFKYWDPKHIKKIARDQWQLLYSGFVSLKPGGILIYSTCTFEPEENEAVVNKLLKKFGDQAQLLPIELPIENIQSGLSSWQDKPFHPDIHHCTRILPTDAYEGFFVAKIRKATAC